MSADILLDEETVLALGDTHPCQATLSTTDLTRCGKPGVFAEGVCRQGHRRRGALCTEHRPQVRCWPCHDQGWFSRLSWVTP